MNGRRILRLGLAAAAAFGLAGTGFAQSPAPRSLTSGPGVQGIELVQFAPREGSQPRMRGGLQGRFDYYALVMSWSPTHCETTDRPDVQQCRPRDGRRFSFILHGLWPQYERGYPENCPSDSRPFVSQRTIDGMADIMPSKGLMIHEYRKHGVCSGLDPDGYFGLSRKLFEKIRVPKRFQAPDQNQMVDTSAVIDEFVATNPGLKPDMLAVSCGGPGNRLREVRVCFTQDGQFRSCGSNENQRRLCASPRVFVPPVRLSRGEPRGGEQGGGRGFAPSQIQPGQIQPGQIQPGQIQPGQMLPGPVPPNSRNL